MQQTFEITWWRGSPSGPVPEQTRVQSRTKKAVTDDATRIAAERGWRLISVKRIEEEPHDQAQRAPGSA